MILTVALLMEGVDRNCIKPLQRWRKDVALLMEGVDRNRHAGLPFRASPVALLMEGVDRNILPQLLITANWTSPSSWRAWIEIGTAGRCRGRSCVALLMEGVDRNTPQGS